MIGTAANNALTGLLFILFRVRMHIAFSIAMTNVGKAKTTKYILIAFASPFSIWFDQT